MPHVLVVEDEEEICALVERLFVRHGFGVSIALDGAAMFSVIDHQPVHLIILDVNLPGEDGFSLCKRIRARSDVPIIMLTALADHVDRVVGLEIGADDYLVKPFDARELVARAKAVLRRAGDGHVSSARAAARPILRFAGWRLDVSRRELRSADNALTTLSGAEFDLLLALAEYPQQVLSRDRLLDLARGTDHDVFDRSIDVIIGRLRRKIEPDYRDPTLIRTVRNSGYMLACTVARE